MKQYVLLTFLLTIGTYGWTQPAPPSDESRVYRATPEKINDLVHTKLDAHFDYGKSQLNGKVWITLKPHFYPTDSLSLDAKGMDIKEVAVVKGGVNHTLKYRYDGNILDIRLDRTYPNREQYTIYINYTAKPDEYKGKGSAAITDAKGLYFINPRGTEKNKPTQIWTQGETESNSVWLPTIDKPNQKTTEEILMTVPGKYVTLSNGVLASSKNNGDGTRTDDWKMDLPHAPYLIFMGVGDYAIVKDRYKGKEVNYYVEKQYEPEAKLIFGHTPEMMGFYSRVLGVEFPWQKYDQIVGRDYVSGAMENTTATLHQESAQQDFRELTDGNRWEDDIAHELFHQWFGDLVTTESWSNLTLNESFANYSEYLWNEYKYGKDKADEVNYKDQQGYLNSNSANKDLVRFYYNDKEDMFDAVSYNKGGRILHMLRNYVGDSAFFAALHLYLTTNKFKSAEAQQLRLAFEEVTGQDLNWYWNQWYYGSGHPILNVTYSYDATARKANVIVAQTQTTGKVFTLPVAIDVCIGNTPRRYNVWVRNKVDTFSFASDNRPSLINFDAKKILLCVKKENKTIEDYLFQYQHANNYLDRREAIEAALAKQDDATAVRIIADALHDRYAGLRSVVISGIDLSKEPVRNASEDVLFSIAQHDQSRPVKAEAIAKLDELQNPKYASLFSAASLDSSYTVSGNALAALSRIDSVQAFQLAKKLSASPAKGKLATSIAEILVKAGDESAAGILLGNFESLPFGQEKFDEIRSVLQLVANANSMEVFKRGVDDIFDFENALPDAYKAQVNPQINGLLRQVQQKKTSQGKKDQADYLASRLPRQF